MLSQAKKITDDANAKNPDDYGHAQLENSDHNGKCRRDFGQRQG